METTIDRPQNPSRPQAKLGRNPFEKKVPRPATEPARAPSPEKESVQQLLQMLDQIGSKPQDKAWQEANRHSRASSDELAQPRFRFQSILVDLPAQLMIWLLKGVLLARSSGPEKS